MRGVLKLVNGDQNHNGPIGVGMNHDGIRILTIGSSVLGEAFFSQIDVRLLTGKPSIKDRCQYRAD